MSERIKETRAARIGDIVHRSEVDGAIVTVEVVGTKNCPKEGTDLPTEIGAAVTLTLPAPDTYLAHAFRGKHDICGWNAVASWGFGPAGATEKHCTHTVRASRLADAVEQAIAWGIEHRGYALENLHARRAAVAEREAAIAASLETVRVVVDDDGEMNRHE